MFANLDKYEKFAVAAEKNLVVYAYVSFSSVSEVIIVLKYRLSVYPTDISDTVSYINNCITYVVC